MTVMNTLFRWPTPGTGIVRCAIRRTAACPTETRATARLPLHGGGLGAPGDGQGPATPATIAGCVRQHFTQTDIMSETKQVLSNNKSRRMQAWARTVYPNNWYGRCSVVTAYLAQLDDDALEKLLLQGWPEIFAIAEREWPEAFAEMNTPESGGE